MSVHDIPLDKAELLAVILEATLYGFSLLMFGTTIWVLFFRRTTQQVNYRMVAVACVLLLLSTMHLIVHIIRVMEGFILNGNTSRQSVIDFFADASQWTFVWENYIYTAQSLVGDAVVLYRCYSVWQSKLIMIVPVLLWCSAFVTGFVGVHTASKSTGGVFVGALAHWIASFWATAFATNTLTTLLLAGRIWYVDHKSMKLRGRQKSPLRHVLRVILDAGLFYSLSFLSGLICFVTQTNGQFVTLAMIMPIISITFYMVIIRVGLPIHRGSQPGNVFGLDNSFSVSAQSNNSADRRPRTEIRVQTSTESKIENGPGRTSQNVITPVPRETPENQVRPDGLRWEV